MENQNKNKVIDLAVGECQKPEPNITAQFDKKEKPEKRKNKSKVFLFPSSFRGSEHRYYRGFFYSA